VTASKAVQMIERGKYSNIPFEAIGALSAASTRDWDVLNSPLLEGEEGWEVSGGFLKFPLGPEGFFWTRSGGTPPSNGFLRLHKGASLLGEGLGRSRLRLMGRGAPAVQRAGNSIKKEGCWSRQLVLAKRSSGRQTKHSLGATKRKRRQARGMWLCFGKPIFYSLIAGDL